MSRKLRFAPPNYPLHITQRGNYRQQVFFSDEDRHEFLALVDHHADLRQVEIHGHALMSNHFHLVVTGQVEHGVSRFMQHLTGQYAQYLHGRLNRRGRLWQGRFYSCVLDTPHFLSALAYVDLNPVRARIVGRAEDYAWSSAAAHCGVAAAADWLDLAALHGRVTPAAWQARLREPQSPGEMAARRCGGAASGCANGVSTGRARFCGGTGGKIWGSTEATTAGSAGEESGAKCERSGRNRPARGSVGLGRVQVGGPAPPPLSNAASAAFNSLWDKLVTRMEEEIQGVSVFDTNS